MVNLNAVDLLTCSFKTNNEVYSSIIYNFKTCWKVKVEKYWLQRLEKGRWTRQNKLNINRWYHILQRRAILGEVLDARTGKEQQTKYSQQQTASNNK